MTTTRRSWIKSLVAIACGDFAVKPPRVLGGLDLGSSKDFTPSNQVEEWMAYSRQSPFGDELPAIPKINDPWPPRHAIALSMIGISLPIELDGVLVRDEDVDHVEFSCVAVPTGIVRCGNGWTVTWEPSRTGEMFVRTKDIKCFTAICEHQGGTSWSVRQAVWTNRNLWPRCKPKDAT